jgi:hypothetical protein
LVKVCLRQSVFVCSVRFQTIKQLPLGIEN